MRNIALIGLTIVALSACQTPTASNGEAPEWLILVGQPLTSVENPNLVVTLNQDRTVSGSGIEGVWEERNGQYCRTITAPAQLAGTECQSVTVNGSQVTFDNRSGRTSTWSF